MKLSTSFLAIAASLLAFQSSALAQTTRLYNGSFENEDPFFGGPEGWKNFTNPGELWRKVGDGDGPILVRTGEASIELRSGNNFAGWTSDTGVDCLGVNNNPLVSWDGGSDVTVTGWYAIPADQPLTGAKSCIKLEFRRANNSIFGAFENLSIEGHTNGEWVQFSYTVTAAQIADIAAEFPPAPVSVSVLPIRFGLPSSTGTIFWDDIVVRQGCPADVDHNGFVNGDDFDSFVAAFVDGDPYSDYDTNCFVNGDDFDAFVSDFVAGC